MLWDTSTDAAGRLVLTGRTTGTPVNTATICARDDVWRWSVRTPLGDFAAGAAADMAAAMRAAERAAWLEYDVLMGRW